MTDVTSIAGSNSLPDLAHRIRAEHEAAKAAMQRGAEHAMNAGDLLIEVKARLKHGEWLPWLRQHCSIPGRTAPLYMRLAHARPEVEANAQRVADLSLRGAIAMLTPDSEGEAILQRLKVGEDELRDAVARLPGSGWIERRSRAALPPTKSRGGFSPDSRLSGGVSGRFWGHNRN